MFGPIDAITREPRSAPARTIVQFRATEFTHTARVARGRVGAFATVVLADELLAVAFGDAFATVFAGAFATDFVVGLVPDDVTRAGDLVAGVRSVTRSGARATRWTGCGPA